MNIKMQVDYSNMVGNLKQSEPDIEAVAIIEGRDNLVYSTENWDIREDIGKVVSIWDSMYGQAINVAGKKYSILQSTIERLVATSLQGGHIVGAKDEERKIIARVRAEGNMLTAYMATARTLKLVSSKEPYLAADAEFGKGASIPSFWDTPKLREELMRGLIDFFKKGAQLEKPDEYDIKRREQERKKRMEELEKVLSALEITDEDRYVNITIKTDFKTDYIYDDFQLLKVKREIEDLIKKEFQIHEPFKVKIVKKL
jgi:hypothetical protein